MSATSAIVVMAHWQVGVVNQPKVLALVAELRRRSLDEPGCQGYDVFLGLEGGKVLLVERYADEIALDAHRASPHYREIVQGQVMPLLQGRSVEFLHPDAPLPLT